MYRRLSRRESTLPRLSPSSSTRHLPTASHTLAKASSVWAPTVAPCLQRPCRVNAPESLVPLGVPKGVMSHPSHRHSSTSSSRETVALSWAGPSGGALPGRGAQMLGNSTRPRGHGGVRNHPPLDGRPTLPWARRSAEMYKTDQVPISTSSSRMEYGRDIRGHVLERWTHWASRVDTEYHGGTELSIASPASLGRHFHPPRPFRALAKKQFSSPGYPACIFFPLVSSLSTHRPCPPQLVSDRLLAL